MLKSAIVKSSFSPKGFLRSFDTGWIRCLFILSYFRLFFRKNPAFFIFPGEKRGHEKRAAASSALLRVSPLAGPNCATAPSSSTSCWYQTYFALKYISIRFLRTWRKGSRDGLRNLLITGFPKCKTSVFIERFP